MWVNNDAQFVTPKTPYAPLSAFTRLEASFRSAATTSAPCASSAGDINQMRDGIDVQEELIPPFAFSELGFRVNARTLKVPSFKRKRTTLPPCAPVAPKTAMTLDMSTENEARSKIWAMLLTILSSRFYTLKPSLSCCHPSHKRVENARTAGVTLHRLH